MTTTVPANVAADMDYTADKLSELDRLPILVCNWPLEEHATRHPVFGQLSRVTGSCSGGIGRHHGWGKDKWMVCIQAVNHLDDMTLVVHYSPWQPKDRYLQEKETERGAAEAFDARFLRELLAVVEELEWIVRRLKDHVKIVFVVDYEGYGVTSGERLVRKLNAIAYAIWDVCPGATIVWYDQHACPAKQDRYESFEPWLCNVINSGYSSCSLYHGGDLYHHAAIIDETWKCAREYGMDGLFVFKSFSSGWKLPSSAAAKRVWDYGLAYPPEADWMFGYQLGNPWFNKRPERFGEGLAAIKRGGVCAWPDLFDVKVQPARSGLHFAAFCYGLHGITWEEK